ncbi:MAG: hypothetical protein HY791_36705 [Deltaproteobacteria bacterium]|nr:hypothetical protein [Deltaproteobacteria bacterium]
MRINLAAVGTGFLLLGQLSTASANDGKLYGIKSDGTREIFQIDVSGPDIASGNIVQISSNAQGWVSNAAARDPRDGRVFFTEALNNARVAVFDPSQSTLNGGTEDCVANPLNCQEEVPLGGTPAGNPQLAGRLGMRQSATSPDPRLFGVAQNIAGRPIQVIDTNTGVSSTYGVLTLGGSPLNTGAGGDQEFNPLDIMCPGPTADPADDFLIPAGSMFVIQNVANPKVWVVPASEINTCDLTAECNLAVVEVTGAITAFGSRQPQGLGFDFNSDPAVNGGRPRAWTTWSPSGGDQGVIAALDPCSGALVSSIIGTPKLISDLASVVTPGLTGFTGTGCRCVSPTSSSALALLLAPALLFFRRRRSA